MSVRIAGFIAGIALFLLVLLLPVPSAFLDAAQALAREHGATVDSARLAGDMQRVLALALLMVTWWLTEAIALPATALLPVVLLPLLHVSGLDRSGPVPFTLRHVLTSYASPVIFLFLGGFLLAGAMQKWRLDRRFTLWLLTRGRLAEDSRAVLLGIMAVTAFLSMWISNTATAAMMLPLGLGILGLMGAKPGQSRYGTALMLGIAWAASIGGVGTIIGSPPNGIALGIFEKTFARNPEVHSITFVDWMKFGVPLVLVLLPLAWFVVLKLNPPEFIALPGGKARLVAERAQLGRLSAGERRTIAVFALAVVCWITNPLWDRLLPAAVATQLSWIDEYAIGFGCGALLFLVPVSLRKGEFTLEWRDTRYVDWGVLMLFGGGIALSEAMFRTGLATWFASGIVSWMGQPSTLVMVAGITLMVELLTEVTSNTAVASMVAPIAISIGTTTGTDPMALTLAAALGASMAFMLPVATPPNALVFGTGYVRIHQMVRTGIVLELSAWALVVAVLYAVAGGIFRLVRF